ncbi:MAG: glycosyltransferase family 4 protein [Clostridium sp.]|jgi:glycosyltransferase involved in cell wall biosynthesis|nr:glycosyltransferase family 4 protein [Clostridium sp.]
MTGICFFIGDMTRSGGTERVTEQVSTLLCDEYRTHIVSLQRQAFTFFYPLQEKVATYTILKKPRKNIQRAVFAFPYIISVLARYIKRNQIDILIDVDSVLDVFSIPLKFFCKVKVISWTQFAFHSKVGTGFRPLIEKISAKFSDATVVLTTKDYATVKAAGKRRGVLRCIPNMVFPVDRMPPAHLQQILSVGRLTYQKGFDYLIDVARLVLPKHPTWRWVIVGEGEERAALTRKIKDNGLEDRVVLAGQQKDVAAYYLNSAIYVLTSRFEGLGMVILEALGQHVPVVSFDCEAGPSDMIADGANGFLVPCFRVEEMANCIDELIESPKKREAFSRASLMKLDAFMPQNVAKQWKALFEEVL